MPNTYDDKRHRREEEKRREKRKDARENKSASRREKERRRKEHANKVLQQANKKLAPSADEDSSKFQALFTKRAEGFLIDLNFRNAPPRPPVGPCFVGPGLDGELNDKWTVYRPGNAVDSNYVWGLHVEQDLGVPLAPSAMDLEGCYEDPEKRRKKELDDAMDTGEGDGKKPSALPPLHPDDDAILNWKGSYGDTAAKELQLRKDKARAAAHLQSLNNGKATNSLGKGNPLASPTHTKSSIQISRGKDSGFQSRVLREANPYFMKKTTYLTNDQSKSVHDFKSLARIKAENAAEIERKMEQHVKKLSDKDSIEHSFEEMKKEKLSTATARKHPTKRNVEAVYEIPLLPDSQSWGHTFTHVVMDNLPKRYKNSKPAPKQLQNAFIVDVKQSEENMRMECNLIVPKDASDASMAAPKPIYNTASKYDLDVMPLKEENAPHTVFVLKIDEDKGLATYHPISSRVQLSSGRPPISLQDNNSIMKRYISRREMEHEDELEVEVKMAEIDFDYAKKHRVDTRSKGITGGDEYGDDNDEDSNGDDNRQNSQSDVGKSQNQFLAGDSSDSDDEF